MSRTLRRLAVLAVATGLALAGSAGTASAHVRVTSDDAAPGGYGVLTFRVPNESDVASTTSLRIQLPTDTPLTFVQAQPVAGWTVSLTTIQLDPPVEVGGDEITEAVGVVQFTATDGGIAPGQFQQFQLLGGPFPEGDSVTFPTVQSYSDGSEAAWIEPTVEGQAEPASPAPVLTLTEGAVGATDAHGSGHGGSDEGSATSGEASGDPGGDATDQAAAAGGSDGLAVTALVLGGLGLVAGLAGLGLGLSARRRTVDG